MPPSSSFWLCHQNLTTPMDQQFMFLFLNNVYCLAIIIILKKTKQKDIKCQQQNTNLVLKILLAKFFFYLFHFEIGTFSHNLYDTLFFCFKRSVMFFVFLKHKKRKRKEKLNKKKKQHI